MVELCHSDTTDAVGAIYFFIINMHYIINYEYYRGSVNIVVCCIKIKIQFICKACIAEIELRSDYE